MTQWDEQKELQALQKYLVSRFFLILLVVTVMEMGADALFGQLWNPLQNWLTIDGTGSLEGLQSVPGIAMLLIFLLTGTLLNALSSAVPAFHWGVDWLERQNAMFFSDVQNQVLMQMPGEKRVVLFLVLVVRVFLLLLPYIIGAIWCGILVTTQVRRLEQMREETHREYDQKRNLMLSDIAHDLRTPITTVYGYAKALNDGMVKPEEQQEYLSAIQAKSGRINDLIQMLFDYVKLDSTGFQLNVKPLDLSELLRQNAALVYSDMEDAGMEFVVDIPEEACMIQADELQLSRVITNLLTNAIRHNPKGSQILLVQKQENLNKITVVIADNGERISPELVSHLFEPFTMGDQSRNSKNGSGLGLSIAYKIVALHGWKLEYVDSYPGYEKAFRLEIKV